MGYERDDDRRTRGAGAIAAFDQGSRNAGPRQKRRALQMRATKVHDARMVAVERGALGRVNLAPVRAGRVDRMPAGGGGGGGARVTRPPMVTKVAQSFSLSPAIQSPPFTVYDTLVIPPPSYPVSPIDLLPPPPVPIAVTPLPPVPAPLVGPKPPTPSGSGGSAPGVGVTGGAGPTTSFDPSTALPPVPSPSGASMQRVLVIGGAALAAFWLLRRSS